MPRPAYACRSGIARAIVILAMTLLSWVSCPFAAVAADPAPTAQATPVQSGTLLLLTARIADLPPRPDVLTIYQSGERYFVPLGQLARTLQLAIDVSPERGVADGFVIREDQRVGLDVARRVATIGSRKIHFDPSEIDVEPDDIYLTLQLLQAWLPLKVDVLPRLALLQVNPLQPLPLQSEIERELRARDLGGGSPERPRYPRVPNPYQLLSGPFASQSVGAAIAGKPGRAPIVQRVSSTTISADLLGLNGQLAYTAPTQTTPESLSFRLDRVDPDPILLGKAHARLFELGDTSAPALEPAADAKGIRGVLISSFPLSTQVLYGETEFSGPLPDGWQVELYSGDILVDFASADGSGTYHFDQVPLYYGDNDFRLVFYGPEGQKRIEQRHSLLSDPLIPPGRAYYAVAAGATHDGDPLAVADYVRGYPAHATLGLSAGIEPVSNGRAHPLERALLRLDGAKSVAGLFVDAGYMLSPRLNGGTGEASQLSVKTDVGPVRVALEDLRLRDFVSPLFPPAADPLRSRDTVSLQTMATPFSLHVPLSFDFRSERYASDAWSSQVTQRFSIHLGTISLRNALVWSRDSSGTDMLSGDIRAQRNFLGTLAAGELTYRLRPDAGPRVATLTLSRALGTATSLQFDWQRDLATGLSHFDLGLVHQLRDAQWQVQASVDSLGAYKVTAGLAFGLGRKPRSGTWTLQPPGIADAGTASVRVFIDQNGNGHLDPGEEPLPDVGILLGGAPTTQKTGADGVVLLDTLSPDAANELSIDLGTLTNPLLIPEQPGVEVIARPGETPMIDLPVVYAGEISGTVSLRHGKSAVGVSGVELELVDRTGAVTAKTTSLYEGFFDLNPVPPGTYTLRVSPEQVKQLGLAPGTRTEVRVPPGGGFVGGIQYTLSKAG